MTKCNVYVIAYLPCVGYAPDFRNTVVGFLNDTNYAITEKKDMTEENHEITLKFNNSEDLCKAFEELTSKGYNISLVADYKLFNFSQEKSKLVKDLVKE